MKKTPLKKSKKKLAKVSKRPLRLLIITADRQLQDWYRDMFPNEKCESCGAKFELIHHFIEKSRSSLLRFNSINLIFLCHKCHALHHRFGDTTVMARVILKRGQEWFTEIERLKRISIQLLRGFIEDQIKKYEKV